ncbi:hypothetical protein ACP4OV_017957 [Aristida adscensionis]
MRLAATKPGSFLLAKPHHPVPTPRARLAAAAADPCTTQAAKKSRGSRAWTWRAAVASGGDGSGEGDDEAGGPAPSSTGAARARRRARLSARRRERVRLPDGVSGADVGGFLRRPAGVESLLNTGALQSFAPAPAGSGAFSCTLRPMGFLGFEVAPVLDLRVAPTDSDCTVEMLSCRFEGSESIERQNEVFSAFMRNHITWAKDGEEPCLDIDVNLEVTLEVYTKPFNLLPLSAVEKPGNMWSKKGNTSVELKLMKTSIMNNGKHLTRSNNFQLMQGLLDRLVPMLGEQLLRDYHSWVEQQAETSS